MTWWGADGEDHKWDITLDVCTKCGLSKQFYLQSMDWDVIWCAGSGTKNKSCCANESPVYLGQKWMCETCGRDREDYKMRGKCTCGASKTSNPDHHSNWCDQLKAPW